MFSLSAMDRFITFILLQVFLLLFTLGCEETLPSRDEDFPILIETEFSTVNGKTSLAFVREHNVPHPLNPLDLKLSLRFINTYTETLQGLADSIDGSLDIWLRDEPSFGKRFPINKDSEVQPIGAPSRIDQLHLTIDPGDTFYLEFHWDHESEEEVKMWDYFNMEDSQLIEVKVNAIAKLRLYPELPLIITPVLQLDLTYFWVDGTNAPR